MKGASSSNTLVDLAYLYIVSANSVFPTPVSPSNKVCNPLGGYIIAALACKMHPFKLSSLPINSSNTETSSTEFHLTYFPLMILQLFYR